MSLNKDFKSKFGKKLAYIRKTKNISQMELAEAIDSSFNYISQIECGRANTNLNKIILLADALNVNAEEFFKF